MAPEKEGEKAVKRAVEVRCHGGRDQEGGGEGPEPPRRHPVIQKPISHGHDEVVYEGPDVAPRAELLGA